MDVIQFLAHFKNDIPNPGSGWTYDDYLIWQSDFFNKTVEFHNSAKHSFFKLTNEIIENGDYKAFYSFNQFQSLGLFNAEDSMDFIRLVTKASSALLKSSNQEKIEEILDYLYRTLDFMFLEMDYSNYFEEFKITLNELSNNIKSIEHLDPKEHRSLVEQMIERIK